MNLFKIVPSPTLKRENMVVAAEPIQAGSVIVKRSWLARTNFVVHDEEALKEHQSIPSAPTGPRGPITCPRGHTQCQGGSCESSSTKGDEDGQRVEFGNGDAVEKDQRSQALGGGTIISKMFEQFKTPAHLQMACSLIETFSVVAQHWVTDKSLVRRTCNGVSPLTPDRHRVGIQWLKSRGVATQTLLFWVNRENFTVLYDMVVANAVTFDFLLSGTTVGLCFCPILALFNHSCIPNVHVQLLPNGYTMVANRDIAEGEEICRAYAEHAIGLVDLEEVDTFLHNRFGFHCTCPLHTASKTTSAGTASSGLLFKKEIKPPRPLSKCPFRTVALKDPLLKRPLFSRCSLVQEQGSRQGHEGPRARRGYWKVGRSARMWAVLVAQVQRPS